MKKEQIKAIREKTMKVADKTYKTRIFQYWIDGNGRLCRARLENLGTMDMYKDSAIEILD